LLDQLNLALRRGDAFLRFLLKGVEYIDRIMESNGIHRPIGVPLIVGHDFKYRASAERFERFDSRVLLARLSSIKSLPYVPLHGPREGLQVSSR